MGALKKLVILMIVLFGKSFLITGQISYTQNFNLTGLNSWTNQNGSGSSTTTAPCVTRSIRYNQYSAGTGTWNFASPSLTGNNGGQITMTYQYKVINYSGGAGSAANWGTIKVQYASALAGPWTDAPGSEINSTNHVVSNACATKTATFTPGIGALYVRFNSVWNSASNSDVYVYFDEVSISQDSTIGCTNPQACNFSPDATQDNGSCLVIGLPCNDNNSNTFNDTINSNCTCIGTLVDNGCTNPQACNYNSAANQDNGTCLVIGNTCDDNLANTINDIVTSECICAGTPTDLNGNNENTYQGLFYQAVARNADGTPMANQNVSIRFSLHQSTAAGTIEYQEVQNVNSNALGLFTTYFGSGQASVGNFNNIQWGINAKYLQVEMYTTNWQTLGTQQLAAVPYAIRAQQVEPTGLKLQSPNGNCYILQVNNSGQLSTIAVPCD
jgi:hypothetical protein